MDISEKLKKLREIKGWSKSECAEYMGVPLEIYGRWEKGNTGNADINMIEDWLDKQLGPNTRTLSEERELKEETEDEPDVESDEDDRSI